MGFTAENSPPSEKGVWVSEKPLLEIVQGIANLRNVQNAVQQEPFNYTVFNSGTAVLNVATTPWTDIVGNNLVLAPDTNAAEVFVQFNDGQLMTFSNQSAAGDYRFACLHFKNWPFRRIRFGHLSVGANVRCYIWTATPDGAPGIIGV
jgi:hypothetical protein